MKKCKNLPDGFYQSCKSCSVYVSCVNKILMDDLPCGSETEWDDTEKLCVRVGTSTTCDSGGGIILKKNCMVKSEDKIQVLVLV